MRLTYDPKRNIGYISFREKTAYVETVRVSDEINVDIAPDGSIYGIELLNANEQLAGDSGGVLLVEDASTGRRSEIALALDQ